MKFKITYLIINFIFENLIYLSFDSNGPNPKSFISLLASSRVLFSLSANSERRKWVRRGPVRG